MESQTAVVLEQSPDGLELEEETVERQVVKDNSATSEEVAEKVLKDIPGSVLNSPLIWATVH